MRFLLAVLLSSFLASAQDAHMPQGYRALFNGHDLAGWESRGDGHWTVLSNGILVGQRVWDRALFTPSKANFHNDQQYHDWLNRQAWLYTKQDYGDFDLHVEFWTKTAGNSGVSLRDPSRAEYAIADHPDFRRTPAHLGYEIQINNRYPDPTPTGSIYTFTKAPKDAMHEDDWNTFDIEARKDTLRVKLNGKLVSGMKCDPKRPVRGPIGLQLHDQFSIIQFRNIWIKDQ
jgi:3-keto-disaccharide hydrolase